MGGDRDGNPFVTAEITRKVLYLARWKAADLFLNDIRALAEELSMARCTEEFRNKYGDHLEPYRFVVKALRSKLTTTLAYYGDLLADRIPHACSCTVRAPANRRRRSATWRTRWRRPASPLSCRTSGSTTTDRKSTRLNSSHPLSSRMPSSA